jgi:hypothetical protein
MNNNENILAEFKIGDELHRLNLYMLHRDMREEFHRIENDESTTSNQESFNTGQIVINPIKKYEKHSLLVKMKRWCFTLLS